MIRLGHNTFSLPFSSLTLSLSLFDSLWNRQTDSCSLRLPVHSVSILYFRIYPSFSETTIVLYCCSCPCSCSCCPFFASCSPRKMLFLCVYLVSVLCVWTSRKPTPSRRKGSKQELFSGKGRASLVTSAVYFEGWKMNRRLWVLPVKRK